MENTSNERIESIVSAQREYFKSGATRSIAFRKEQLKKLSDALGKWEKPILDALWADLHKSAEEAYLTEVSLVLAEARTARKHVGSWARKRLHKPAIAVMPSNSYTVKEPLGNSLIVSPWNYPVQLLLNPLVGAIAAGCTAVLKPSPYVPTVAKAIEDMIQDTFDEQYIAVVQGNREVNKALFATRFDVIFYTGSPAVGREVMAAAAKNLTPVVLELGGKSPCIVAKEADIEIAAKRIAWGKTLNAGQTCIAPDYILIHKDVKEAFVKAFEEKIHKLHGSNVQESEHFVRMVSDRAFDRVSGYLSNGSIICGGHTDKVSRYIEPTLIEGMALDSPVMTEEIFGPIFPVITLDDEGGSSFEDKVADFVTSREKPLAFYYFGKAKKGWDLIGRTSSGGGCLNDTIMHIVNGNVPFGGVGNSGLGHYHHRESFEAFTHTRTILSSPRAFDHPLRYMPYKFFGLMKKII